MIGSMPQPIGTSRGRGVRRGEAASVVCMYRGGFFNRIAILHDFRAANSMSSRAPRRNGSCLSLQRRMTGYGIMGMHLLTLALK